jgi:hypothetical protein
MKLGKNPWMLDAVCIKEKVNPNIFDTISETNDPKNPNFPYEIQAMACCNRCPVRMECLIYAKRTMREYTGIVGGVKLINGRVREERKWDMSPSAAT